MKPRRAPPHDPQTREVVAAAPHVRIPCGVRTRGLGKTATSFALSAVMVAVAPAVHAQGETHLDKPMLRQRVGVARAESLVLATKFSERLRGIDRLAALGTEEAVKALAGAMSPGTAVRTDPRTRLAAVRALAPHTEEHVQARRVMVSVLNSVRAGAPETPLDVMCRATAALALAKVGSESTLTTLLAAVSGRGRTGELATEALLAFPPADLGPIGRSTKDMTQAVITLLGDLGDPRVIGVLRRQLKRKGPHLQHAAAVSLAKLGDGTPVALALEWGKKKGKDKEARQPLRRIAGAEVLMWLDAPKAPTAIAYLLGDARTRAAGLSLAEASLSPALVPTLQAVVEAKVTPGERARAVTILAKIGGDTAAPVLLGLLARPELTTTAAFGLASTTGDVAADGLARALGAAPAGAPRRLILRAAVVRFLKLGERVDGLSSALAAAFASEDAADRAVGAFGLALLGERDVDELAKSKRPEVVVAAARAALALGPSALSALGERLAKAPLDPDATTIATSAALLVGGHGVATERLLDWAEGGSSLSPVAAFQLARRDSKAFRHRLVALFEGTDPIVRLHVALGLADSPETDAVALLTDAYRFEPDPRVRRGIVRALSLRTEKRRDATLALAASVDPDAEVRALAAAAKRGRKLGLARVPSGREVAFVSLRANSESEKASVASRALVLVRDDGLALPVVSAPDGVILVPGIGDTHRVSVVLAAED